jgi:hypothetical protein
MSVFLRILKDLKKTIALKFLDKHRTVGAYLKFN